MLRQMLAVMVCACALLAVISGCGGSSGKPVLVSPIKIVLNTAEGSASPGQTFQFVATVTGGTLNTVAWSVDGGDSNGSISGTGLFTAPSTPGNYRIVAVSTDDPSVVKQAIVKVQSGIIVTLTPVAPVTKLGDDVQLTAVVSGTTDQRVAWSVAGTGSNGSIDSSGLYTAPTNPGVYQVTVVSQADRTRQAKVNVTVNPGVTLKLVGAQPDLTVPFGKIKLNTRLLGTTNTTINWTISPPGSGTVTSEGTWTAPSGNATYTLTGVSAADPTEIVSKDITVSDTVRARVTVEGKGAFVLDLDRIEAPRHVKNFVDLTNAAFYDGIYFHRYEPGFVIQGGDPLTKTLPLTDGSIGTGGPGYTIDFEPNSLIHDQYALGMARSDSLNSAGSQWYVTLLPAPSLDGSYVVFGKVASGFTVINALRKGDKMTSVKIIP